MDQGNIESEMPSEGSWSLTSDGAHIVDGRQQLVGTVNLQNCSDGVCHATANAVRMLSAKRLTELAERAERLLGDPDPDFLIKGILISDLRATLKLIHQNGWRDKTRFATENAVKSIGQQIQTTNEAGEGASLT